MVSVLERWNVADEAMPNDQSVSIDLATTGKTRICFALVESVTGNCAIHFPIRVIDKKKTIKGLSNIIYSGWRQKYRWNGIVSELFNENQL